MGAGGGAKGRQGGLGGGLRHGDGLGRTRRHADRGAAQGRKPRGRPRPQPPRPMPPPPAARPVTAVPLGPTRPVPNQYRNRAPARSVRVRAGGAAPGTRPRVRRPGPGDRDSDRASARLPFTASVRALQGAPWGAAGSSLPVTLRADSRTLGLIVTRIEQARGSGAMACRCSTRSAPPRVAAAPAASC